MLTANQARQMTLTPEVAKDNLIQYCLEYIEDKIMSQCERGFKTVTVNPSNYSDMDQVVGQIVGHLHASGYKVEFVPATSSIALDGISNTLPPYIKVSWE